MRFSALFAAAVTTAFTCGSSAAFAQAPAGYPSDYAQTVAAAAKEGKVVVYSATDTKAAAPLLKEFQAIYPGVKVEFMDMNSTEVFNRFLSETASGSASADLLWSSAMDLQMKLVNDGYALSYKSPEIPKLPAWSVFRNEAYGTTFEPAVFVYNKRLVPAEDVPKTHADFIKLLTTKTDTYKGKVTTYDIEKAGVGFMFATQDSKHYQGFWDLAKAMGTAGVRQQSSTGTMMERIASGENLIGYNMIGSYALSRAQTDPAIGISVPSDYTLVMSRVMFVSKTAKQPNAAKLFLDFILSQRGQKIIAEQSKLYSIRADIEGEMTAKALQASLGDKLQPIPVGQGLLAYLDQSKRLEFLKQWRQATAGK